MFSANEKQQLLSIPSIYNWAVTAPVTDPASLATILVMKKANMLGLWFAKTLRDTSPSLVEHRRWRLCVTAFLHRWKAVVPNSNAKRKHPARKMMV